MISRAFFFFHKNQEMNSLNNKRHKITRLTGNHPAFFSLAEDTCGEIIVTLGDKNKSTRFFATTPLRIEKESSAYFGKILFELDSSDISTFALYQKIRQR